MSPIVHPTASSIWTWTTTAQKTFFSATSAAAFVIGSGGTNQYAINGVFASPYGSNEILVNSVFSGFAYPAVLNSMDMIGSSDLFAAVSFQSLAYSFQYSSGGGLSPVEQNGNWLGVQTANSSG